MAQRCDPPAPPDAGAPAVTSALNVLVGDDHRASADALAELIGLALPASVDRAYGGTECLQLALQSKPDVMILDLRMPDMGGVEVARHVRQAFPQKPPYLIALTGEAQEVHDLDALEALFDRVLAKPVDFAGLASILAGYGQSPGTLHGMPRRFDVTEVVVRVARQVVAHAHTRHVPVAYDHVGPSPLVDGEPSNVASGMHRLLLGFFDIMPKGFVLIRTEAVCDLDGGAEFSVSAAGAGSLSPLAEIDAALSRLFLRDTEDPAPGSTRVLRGRCPNTGAALSGSIDEEGVLLRARFTYSSASPNEAAVNEAPAGARAWLVDAHALQMLMTSRRLQRQGWRVETFSSCTEAISALRVEARHGVAPPALLIVVEAGALPREDMAALGAELPLQAQRVLAVLAGSASLELAEVVPGYEVSIMPFSSVDLSDLARLARSEGQLPFMHTSPAELGLDERPLVLLVDDNVVNRMVGQALVEALGYRCETAHDGLDAIDQCRRHAPHLVLMDLDMPVLGGLQAAMRLRKLQKAGGIEPFTIVAASAHSRQEALPSCMAAGMDEYLEKPLHAELLRAALRRFTDPTLLRTVR